MSTDRVWVLFVEAAAAGVVVDAAVEDGPCCFQLGTWRNEQMLEEQQSRKRHQCPAVAAATDAGIVVSRAQGASERWPWPPSRS